jgi:hypothetical protein
LTWTGLNAVIFVRPDFTADEVVGPLNGGLAAAAAADGVSHLVLHYPPPSPPLCPVVIETVRILKARLQTYRPFGRALDSYDLHIHLKRCIHSQPHPSSSSWSSSSNLS